MAEGRDRFSRRTSPREAEASADAAQRPPVGTRRGPRLAIPSTRSLLPSTKRISHATAILVIAIRDWWRRVFGGPGQVSPWSQLNPSGSEQNAWGIDVDLNGVAMPDDNTIVAVGNLGVIIRSTDFGANWNLQNSGTGKDLFGIAFTDATNGLAVGDYGVILATGDGGATWSDITPGEIWSARDIPVATNADGTNYVEVLPGPDYCLRAVAFSWNQPDRAVVVGDVNGGRALMLANDAPGSRFTRWRDLSDWSCGPLYDVAFSDVAAVAVGGNPSIPWDSNRFNFTFSQDDAASWHASSSAPRSPFCGVAFSDSITAFAVSPYEPVVRTRSRGDLWDPVDTPLTSDCGRTALADIQFGTALTGFIVGDYGVVMRTNDRGTTWTQIGRQTRLFLRAVAARDSQRAAVVSHGFTVLTTADGGQTWGGRATLTMRDLRGLSFADAQNGMIVGDKGDVFRTTDGGATWRALTFVLAQPPVFAQWPLDDVVMLDANTAIAIGPNMNPEGWIWRTTDGGASWSRVLAPTASGAEGYLRSVSFADALNGMALGPTRVLVTSDGGASWSERPLPAAVDLRAIRCVTPTLAFAVGAGGAILRTTDSGATWQTLSSGVTSLLLGLCFINANQGWVVGADLPQFAGAWENVAVAGVILRTTDGGNTWQRQVSGTGLPLRGVSFANSLVGAAVGGKGWENYTGPEDPIVLWTTDGGATWSRQQLGARVKNLYRVALLDPLTGVAIGRRGTILRTTTGGI